MKKEKRNKQGIRFKISATLILMCIASIALVCIVFFVGLRAILYGIANNGEKLDERIMELSSSTMSEQITDRMKSEAKSNAGLADLLFVDVEHSVRVLANAAERVYAGGDSYPQRVVSLPDMEMDGTLTTQLLYTTEADPDDPSVQKEIGRLGNLQDILLAENDNSEASAVNYIVSETGIIIRSDMDAGSKYDKDGNIMRYEPDKLSWYAGAKESGDVYFTPVSIDENSGKKEIVCSIPIFYQDRIMGVAAAAMYLDDIQNIMRDGKMGGSSEECILDSDGKILFSTKEDLELSGILEKFELTEDHIFIDEIEGMPYYISYASIESVHWTYLVMVPEKDINAPIVSLLKGIADDSEETTVFLEGVILKILLILLLVIVSIVLAVILTGRHLSMAISKPIIELTDKVGSMNGENLDFIWEKDTGDETQLLADSFKDLTERVKKYIIEVQEITAEKERIGAELNVARKIQADMLPKKFPAFPDRKEFDIYASMNPAKEVGGDFYDFFLVDDDHLAIVMADVSGKGVPAALFMAIAKTLIKTQTKIIKKPDKVLEKVNRMLFEVNDEGMFVTVWLGIMEISTGEVVAANAGHEYPAIRNSRGCFELFKDPHSTVIGVLDDEEYDGYKFRMEEGDCLFVYTDGVVEARNTDQKFFEFEGMINALNREAFSEPKELLEIVKKSIDEFAGDEAQFDDITMLAIERKEK